MRKVQAQARGQSDSEARALRRAERERDMRSHLAKNSGPERERREIIERLVRRLADVDDDPELLFITNGELDRTYFERYLRQKYGELSDDELRAEDERARRLSERDKTNK